MNLLVFLLVLAVLLVLLNGRAIAGRRRGREEPSRQEAEIPEWRKQYEAENPDQPPFSQEEIDGFGGWYASLALPAVELLPAPERPVAAGGTRIGGPVWLEAGETWPVDEDGAQLEFIAQVDFAELPPLPDFPTTGLMQFFIGRDDLFGAVFEAPEKGAARVIWRPDGFADGRPVPQAEVGDGPTPYASTGVRETGLSLVGQRVEQRPSSADWRILERLAGHNRRPGIDRIDALMEDDPDGPHMVHHVGGHPVFTQDDIRSEGRLADYDRTLLRLTSDDSLMWGDMGEAVFLIRRADLLARDFSAVIFNWDCG